MIRKPLLPGRGDSLATLLLPTVLFLLAPLVASAQAGSRSGQESDAVRVTVLFDNTVADARLRPAWGFAALIERAGHTLLLDTGASAEILLGNIDSLGISLEPIEAIAISHAHGDHTLGLPGLAARGIHVPLFVLPGFPDDFREQFGSSFTLREVAAGQELIPGVFSTGEMVDPAVGIPEQSLVIPTDSGLVIITGCAHQGVVAIVQRAIERFQQPVYLVMGGFHLLEKSEAQVQEVVAAFRRLGVRRVGATHCTGESAIAAFKAAYGEDFVALGAGRVLIL